jgi:hypothetical protein
MNISIVSNLSGVLFRGGLNETVTNLHIILKMVL